MRTSTSPSRAGVYTFASDQTIDVATNVPGLTVTGDGTPTVTVAGITSLAVNVGFAGDTVGLHSTDVPTAVDLTSNNAIVTLGDYLGANDLSNLTSPVTVTGPGVGTTNTVTLDDRGSPANHYVIGGSTVTAANGFGGLTYSGVSDLNVFGAILASGGNTFAVDAAASLPALHLDGGGNGNDTLNLDAGGLAITPANFTPLTADTTEISGAPLPGGPIDYSNFAQVNVTNLSAVSPVVTASTINGVQGQRLVDVGAGTFTTTAPGAKAGDFLATVQWGDGTQSAGAIAQDASDPSVFYVTGTHTYYEDDPALATHVIVASLGSSSTQIINGVPVTFSTGGTDPVTSDGTAVIDNAPISVTAGSFSGFENIAPSPTDVFAASFIDYGGVNPADPNPAARYSVLINWGDGTAPLPVPAGGIVRNGTSNSYTVTVPQHVYSTPGNYVVTVTVSDGGANAVVSTATGVAYIADAPLTPAMLQPVIAPATEGVQIANAQLASFTDADPLSNPGDFKVVIDWGDGSPMSYGTLAQPGGAGNPYIVEGTHTYADAMAPGAPPVAWGPGPIAGPVTAAGTYPIHIYVQDAHGSTVNMANTITVNDNPLNLIGRLNPASDSGASYTDGITNVVQPNFQGWTSEGGALVYLYATPTAARRC